MDWRTCTSDGTSNGILTISCVPLLFKLAINILLGFSGFIALIFIITSGIKLILSGGDAKKVGAAQKTLTYALLGLAVILLSFFIIDIISGATGVKCIMSFGFNSCE